MYKNDKISDRSQAIIDALAGNDATTVGAAAIVDTAITHAISAADAKKATDRQQAETSASSQLHATLLGVVNSIRTGYGEEHATAADIQHALHVEPATVEMCSQYQQSPPHLRDSIGQRLSQIIKDQAANLAAAVSHPYSFKFVSDPTGAVRFASVSWGSSFKEQASLGSVPNPYAVEANEWTEFTVTQVGFKDSTEARMALNTPSIWDALQWPLNAAVKPRLIAPQDALSAYDLLGLTYDQAPFSFVVVALQGSTVVGSAATDALNVLNLTVGNLSGGQKTRIGSVTYKVYKQAYGHRSLAEAAVTNLPTTLSSADVCDFADVAREIF